MVNKNEFTFDRVFDINSSQIEVYNHAAKPIIESVMDGFNGTVFAYGQTGSGKTFTMQGPDIEDLEMQGIVPRMVRTVFNKIDNSSENIEFTVKVSMMEIYMEKIRDLLDPTKSNMQIKVDKSKGIFVADLTERYIGSDQEVYEIMRIGNENRKVASTIMNDQSSRSHSIFVMTIHQTNLDDQISKTGILYLVDLAGSEKVGKTGAKGQTLDEAKGINKSLSTLGKVINSLTDGKSKHIPYRESKLTRILSESLGGNARTALIITCSPSVYNDMETISTLRFGTAARNIKNKPKINKELTVAEMKKLLEKSEKIIQVKSYRVEVLEKIIKQSGQDVPEDEYKDLKLERKHTSNDHHDKLESEHQEPENEKEEEVEVKEEIIDNNEEEKQIEEEFEEIDAEEIAKNRNSTLKERELDEQLKRLKEKLNIETDKFWNLSDEYQVTQNKLTASQEENQTLLIKNQSLVEEIEEKNDMIETLNEKLKVMNEELNNVTESHDKLVKKLSKLEELGGFYLLDIDEDGTSKDKHKNLQNSLQKELIKLSKKLKTKERILKRIENLSDLSDDIKKIFNSEDSNIEEEAKDKQSELYDEFKQALINPQSDLIVFKGKNLGLYFNENEVNQIVKWQIELRDKLKHDEKVKVELQGKIDSLSEELRGAVEESNPNIKAITKKLADEIVMKAQTKWDDEKEQIIKDLENRVSKVVELEMALDESEERFRRLENNMNQGDVTLRKKINKLESQSEQLTLMYHQVVSEKSVLKVDFQVAEKKLKRKDEKISSLEKTLNKLRDQNTQLKKILVAVKSLKMRAPDENKVIESNNVTGIPSSGRIVKPLRGGRKEATPRGAPYVDNKHSQLIHDLKDSSYSNKNI